MRVLKPSGSIFVNLGDKYAMRDGQGGPQGATGQRATRRQAGTYGNAEARDWGVRTKSLLGLPWRYAIRCIDELGLILRAEIVWSKCLSGGVVVYARTRGRVQTIKLHDLCRNYQPEDVELWTGEKWSRVLRMDPTPPTEGRSASSAAARQARYRGKPIPPLAADLEIELRSGERIGCTPNHKWPTTRGEVRADELLIGDVIQTTALPDEAFAAVGLDDADVGWFVGMYLAEGSRSEQTIQIAGHIKETERAKRLEAIAAAYHGTCRTYQTSDNGVTTNLTGRILLAVLDTYLGGRTAKTKRLAPAAWQRSNAFLRGVLAGYLDGDGYYRPDTDEVRVNFTANDGLAEDLRALGARLGRSVRLRRTVHTFDGRQFPGWAGSIREHATRRQPDSQVVAIRQSRAREFWNIEIADDPHLFALASGVLTRNSNGLPESVTDRVRRSHEQVFHFVKQPRYYSAVDEVREPHGDRSNRTPGRYATTARGLKGHRGLTAEQRYHALGALPGSVWEIPTSPLTVPDHLGVDHFAAYPPELVRRIVLGWSPREVCTACGEGRRPVVDRERTTNGADKTRGPGVANLFRNDGAFGVDGRTTVTLTGYACACPDTTAPTTPGVVLDPFGGTGTTALVASVHGRVGISVDLSADYCRLAQWRTTDPGERARVLEVPKPEKPVEGQLGLFEGMGP